MAISVWLVVRPLDPEASKGILLLVGQLTAGLSAPMTHIGLVDKLSSARCVIWTGLPRPILISVFFSYTYMHYTFQS